MIYSDSGIVEKVSGARAKTETIVNRFLVPEVFCLGVSTDSNNHEWKKLFPIVIQTFHEVYDIESKLIQLFRTPNEKLVCDTQENKHMASLQSALNLLLTTWALILENSIAQEE